MSRTFADLRAALEKPAPAPAPAPAKAAAPARSASKAEPERSKLGLDERIGGLTADSTPAEVTDVLGALAKLTSATEVEQRLRAVKKQTGLGLPHLRKEVGIARSQLGQKEQQALGPDKNGIVYLDWSGQAPDFQVALDLVTITLQSANRRAGGKAFPTLTTKLGRVVSMAQEQDGTLAVEQLSDAQADALINTKVQTRHLSDMNGLGPRQPLARAIRQTTLGTIAERLPPTPEVSHVPVFLGDGSLLSSDGWEREAGVVLHLDPHLGDIDVADKPSPEDVRVALVTLLTDVLGDFPFADQQPNGTETPVGSRANALAMLLTPFMRRLFVGVAPVFWITKPTAGTGGTLLGELPSLLALGEPAIGFPYSPTNEEENRKALVAALMAGDQHLFFDDVRDFNSRVMLQTITSTQIGGRILGQSNQVKTANTLNMTGTGNNTYFSEEMQRRVCFVRLNARTTDIHNRKFQHADFRGWVRIQRGRIISALLTLVQAWIVAGRPEWRARRLTSFEPWGAAVGGVLAHAGVEGFLSNRRAAGVDPRHAEARRFVQAWAQQAQLAGGATQRQLFNWASDSDSELVEGRDEADQRRRFYRRLGELEGVTFAVAGSALTVASSFDADGEMVYTLDRAEIQR